MNKKNVSDLLRTKARIERGDERPARVWEVKPDGKGGFTRRAMDPKAFQRAQKIAWKRSVAATRERLGLSQTGFAELLGISVRTLHHWEQGTRTPTGAARVLLKIAALNPKVVLQAAA